MRKLKTVPFTLQQVKECLCSKKYKTIGEIAKELAKKINKCCSSINNSFLSKVKALLSCLITKGEVRECSNTERETIFGLA
jgi:hypothetical protein